MRLDLGAVRIAVRRTRETVGAAVLSILIVQGLSAAAIVPAMSWLFDRALGHAGLVNLTDRSLSRMLADPLADLLLVAIGVLVIASVLAQMGALLSIAHRHQRGVTPSFGGVLMDVGRLLRRAAHPQLPVLALYLLLVVPLSGLGVFFVVTQGITVPPFITREFLKAPLSAVIYLGAIGAIVAVGGLLVYTVPAMVVGRLTPLRAMWLSVRMTIRSPLHVVVTLVVPAALGAVLSTGFSDIAIGYSSLGTGTTPRSDLLVVGLAKAAGFMVLTAAMLTANHLAVRDTSAALTAEDARDDATWSPRPRARLRSAALACICVGVVFSLGMASAPAAFASPVRSAEHTVILAHRGDVWGGVENTIGALEAAAHEHPDYVEVDMQQTRDGVWVASHDSNLLMTAGIDENIFDMDAAQVTSTVVRQHGHADTIPTMAELVTRAQQLGVTLLLEIKVTGHEHPAYVKDFLRVLDGLGATNHEIYHSLDPSAVTELKKLRPDLRVGLTMAMSAGGLPGGPQDFYVIEQGSFTQAFLDEAHARGKPVYVWTVNDDSRIRQLLRMHVDGIVTDFTARAVGFRDELASGPQPEFAVEDALHQGPLFR